MLPFTDRGLRAWRVFIFTLLKQILDTFLGLLLKKRLQKGVSRIHKVEAQPPSKITNHNETKGLATVRELACRFMAFTEDYHECFNVALRNVSDQARRYLNGLMVKAPRKNMERMEEYVEDFDYQSQQQFLSDSPWSHQKVQDRVALDVSEILGGAESAILIDEYGFSKKGIKSAGVARQYNVRLGKVDNCQVGVFASLTDGKNASLVASRLFLPQEWVWDKRRCLAAKVPETQIRVLSKPAMALEMVHHARQLGVKFGWVCLDALYGTSTELLLGLNWYRERFIADVKSSRKVARVGEEGEWVRIDSCFRNPELNWRTVNIHMGEKGVLRVQAAALRVKVKGCGDWEWWAVCVVDPETHETKRFLSNADASTPLETMVCKQAARFWIERGFQEGKTSVGMGDYQARGWVAWHHHMAMVMLAMFILLKERRIHLIEVELLSFNDIVQLLNVYLPRRDASAEQELAHIQRCHIKR